MGSDLRVVTPHVLAQECQIERTRREKPQDLTGPTAGGRIFLSDPTSLRGRDVSYKLVGYEDWTQATAAARLDVPIR
jgi:hypothetical protein